MFNGKRSILFSYILSACVIVFTVLAMAWYSTDRYHDFFIQQLTNNLSSRAISVAQNIKSTHVNKNNCEFLKQSDPTTRVSIIDLKGLVLCDSEAEAITMDNHFDRPEIKEALDHGVGSIIRFSNTVQHALLYVAKKIERNKRFYIIRTAIPLLEIDSLLDELFQQFYVVMILLLGTIGYIMWSSYNKINKPLGKIIKSAALISQGKFDTHIPEFEIKEVSQLSIALNDMTAHLGRLTNLRQDFVANVSHELKTPIATIQSYVETLLDGAMHDKKDVHRFLSIVLKQNNRLANIVDDLLLLSRLESVPINELIEWHKVSVKELMQSAKELCADRANKKQIKINVKIKEHLKLDADQSLLLQAIVNLLDNAIKYSEKNTKITLSAHKDGDMITLQISDQGPGISEEHFYRIFERFYRPDKSRSRREGGTGLGLAIVKNIVQIHGGTVAVENNAKGGCRFLLKFNKNKI